MEMCNDDLETEEVISKMAKCVLSLSESPVSSTGSSESGPEQNTTNWRGRREELKLDDTEKKFAKKTQLGKARYSPQVSPNNFKGRSRNGRIRSRSNPSSLRAPSYPSTLTRQTSQDLEFQGTPIKLAKTTTSFVAGVDTNKGEREGAVATAAPEIGQLISNWSEERYAKKLEDFEDEQRKRKFPVVRSSPTRNISSGYGLQENSHFRGPSVDRISHRHRQHLPFAGLQCGHNNSVFNSYPGGIGVARIFARAIRKRQPVLDTLGTHASPSGPNVSEFDEGFADSQSKE